MFAFLLVLASVKAMGYGASDDYLKLFKDGNTEIRIMEDTDPIQYLNYRPKPKEKELWVLNEKETAELNKRIRAREELAKREAGMRRLREAELECLDQFLDCGDSCEEKKHYTSCNKGCDDNYTKCYNKVYAGTGWKLGVGLKPNDKDKTGSVKPNDKDETGSVKPNDKDETGSGKPYDKDEIGSVKPNDKD